MSTLPGPRGPGPGGPPGNDSSRLMLTLAVSFGLILVYQSVFDPPKPPQKPAPTAGTTTGGPAAPEQAPPLGNPTVAPSDVVAEEPPAPESTVTLQGPRLRLGISTHGGRVVQAMLPQFVEHVPKRGETAEAVDLASLQGPQGGSLRLSFEGHPALANYRVTDQTDQSVTLEREGGGFKVVRRYRFDPASHGVRHDVEITNTTEAPRTISPTVEMTGEIAKDEKDRGGFMSMGVPTDQTTFVCETAEELYREPAVALSEPHTEAGTVAWAGVDRQYFLGAYVPREVMPKGCTSTVDGNAARVALQYDALTVAPGQTVKLGSDAYFGPKQEAWLTAVDPKLSNAIDYGWFGVLVRLLLALLVWFYKIIPNYGVAIFLLTLTVKLITLPLSQKQFISMQRMKDIAPHIKELQAKYAHDKAMQGQKMMELYKQHNVNPAGGCLPMLIQMPVWIALYRTLYTSVELYQQPFISGWINDLTQKDPYYITPIALGVVMLIQAVLTPQPQDNPQMKYMQYGMPLFFTFLMATLPSGLTLYMFFNAVLTIVQQLYIKRRFGTPEGAKPATA